MPYLIGTDEAGYGPNLGPLVIAGSRWRLPEVVLGELLYARLAPVVVAHAKRGLLDAGQVALADSKVLYSPARGVELLEQGLWITWGMLGARPVTLEGVWQLIAPGACTARHEALCGRVESLPVPLVADMNAIDAALPGIRKAFHKAGVCLEAIRSRAVFPAEFNRAVTISGSKGASLSRWTLQLVKELLPSPLDDAAHIVCDKHGGRDRYLPILTEAFPGAFIEILRETSRQSDYRIRLNGQCVEIAFQAKGETHMPTALASMTAKYLRELAMLAFNRFWQEHLPELKPTAGYPQDAARFHREIATILRGLGIASELVWRTK